MGEFRLRLGGVSASTRFVSNRKDALLLVNMATDAQTNGNKQAAMKEDDLRFLCHSVSDV